MAQNEPAGGIVDCGEEFVQFVTLGRFEYFLAVDVVPDMRQIVIPMHRHVSYPIRVLE